MESKKQLSNGQTIINCLEEVIKSVYADAYLVKSEITESGLYCDYNLPEPVNPQRFEGFKERMGKYDIPGICELTGFSGVHREGSDADGCLQRIYVTAFDNERDYQAHLDYLAEARERDHKVLGAKHRIYLNSEEIGAGLILWSTKGAAIRFALERFAQDAHVLNGYEWVYTPHIGRAKLWETSGHLDYYKDSMYAPISVENEQYYLKPMNCPFHVAIYNSEVRSYQRLPVRYAEFGAVYRHELSGTLNGLTRVRGFTQDDAHIICTPDQIKAEVINALQFSLYILRSFGLNDFNAYISTKPVQKSIGSDEDWLMATGVLKEAVLAAGLCYKYDEGGGAFYGPKIDLKLQDALGREWQLSTIQFDFNLPERFKMSYIGRDGGKHTPYMVHRALFGSLERFTALLIEHYRCDFPLWFSPVQIGIVPVNAAHNEYVKELNAELKGKGLRVSVNCEDIHMREKIKRFEQERCPYIFVAGDKDIAAGGFAVRKRAGESLGQMNIKSFLEYVKPELEMGIPRYVTEI